MCALADIGIATDVVSDIESFYQAVTLTAYNGVLVDIPTKVLALRDHQDLVHSILSHYPVIQLNIDRDTGRIRALRLGGRETRGTLEELLAKDRLLPEPRCFREYRRQKLHFNVLLSLTGDFTPGTAIRTVTLDVSEGGCFLYYDADRPLPERIWLKFVDLSDTRPIAAAVRSWNRWGESLKIPGVGVEFVGIPKSQLREIVGPLSLPTSALGAEPSPSITIP